MTTPETFLRHSDASVSDNALVKSFIRPEKWGGEYLNPHAFDVAQDRYVRPSGAPATSKNPTQEVECSHGFVMHYICRSVEHYIQRIRRRINVDLVDSMHNFHHFDLNQHEDREPLRMMARTKEILGEIHDVSIKSAITLLKNNAFFHQLNEPEACAQESSHMGEPMNVSVVSYFNTRLYFSHERRTVSNTTPEEASEKHPQPVRAQIHPETSDLVTFSLDGEDDTPLTFPGSAYLGEVPIYRIERMENGEYALKHPIQDRFMTLLPPQLGNDILADRTEAREWEYVRIFIEPDRDGSVRTVDVSHNAFRNFSAKRLRAMASMRPPGHQYASISERLLQPVR